MSAARTTKETLPDRIRKLSCGAMGPGQSNIGDRYRPAPGVCEIAAGCRQIERCYALFAVSQLLHADRPGTPWAFVDGPKKGLPTHERYRPSAPDRKDRVNPAIDRVRDDHRQTDEPAHR